MVELTQDSAQEIANDLVEGGSVRPLIALLRRLIKGQGPRAFVAARLYLNLSRVAAPSGVAVFESFAFGDVLQLINSTRRTCFSVLRVACCS